MTTRSRNKKNRKDEKIDSSYIFSRIIIRSIRYFTKKKSVSWTLYRHERNIANTLGKQDFSIHEKFRKFDEYRQAIFMVKGIRLMSNTELEYLPYFSDTIKLPLSMKIKLNL